MALADLKPGRQISSRMDLLHCCQQVAHVVLVDFPRLGHGAALGFSATNL